MTHRTSPVKQTVFAISAAGAFVFASLSSGQTITGVTPSVSAQAWITDGLSCLPGSCPDPQTGATSAQATAVFNDGGSNLATAMTSAAISPSLLGDRHLSLSGTIGGQESGTDCLSPILQGITNVLADINVPVPSAVTVQFALDDEIDGQVPYPPSSPGSVYIVVQEISSGATVWSTIGDPGPGTHTGNFDLSPGTYSVSAGGVLGYSFIGCSGTSHEFSGHYTVDLQIAPLTTTYTVTTSSSPSNGGTTTGGGAYPSGTQITVSATANNGFEFKNWTENGNVVSITASYPFTVTANRNLVANFMANQPQIEVRRGSSAAAFTNAGAGANIDDPLVPVSNGTSLDQASASAVGLVADGVTPLLIKVSPPPTLSQQTTYNVTFSFPDGGLADVAGHLKKAGGISGTSSVTVAPNSPDWGYISAFNPQDLGTGPELTVRMNLQNAANGADAGMTTFKIRKPPIVLVHGYHADQTTWSSAFVAALRSARTPSISPTDFVVPITYAPIAINTSARLDVSVHLLDDVLTASGGPENHAAGPFANWALTRYDLICHSEGGVLARMLCTKSSPAATNQNFGTGHPWSKAPFRSAANFNRGRFRRIVTVGSPQNGSILPYYIRKLWGPNFSLYSNVTYVVDLATDILQPKFDPFGSQIQEINADGTIIDPDAKVHVLRGVIDPGTPQAGRSPLEYFIIGLNALLPGTTQTRGSIVLPQGSDGVVDFESETAGQTNSSVVETLNGSIAHSASTSLFGSDVLFGVPTGNTETALRAIANRALDLLDGPPTLFGPFVVPALLATPQQSLIDGVIPKSVIIDIIASTGGAKALTAAPLITSTQFTYSLTPPADETLEGDITWLAQVYGPGGVSDSGVTVQPDLNDSTKVTVTVDGDVMGDVVLYAFYISGSGKIVIAKPVLVTSRPAGNALTRIESIPSSLNLSVGDATGLKLWQHFDNDQSSRLYPSQTMPPHFTSSNEAVATVNAAGLVFALDEGTATIGCDYAGFHAETDVTVTDTGAPRTLHNLSTRLFVQTGGNVGIAGFIISGNAPKQVLIRAIGPELAQAPFNVPNTLQSPVLALYAGQTTLVTNDGWQKAPNSGQIPATLKPGDPREPAILTTLQPGSYTAILSGRNGTTGNALVEVYDVDNSIAAQVANVSTRGVVQGGGNVMIAGFIAGDTGAKVLIRALGPTLGRSPYDVPNVLQDPFLTIFDANGTQLSSNDDWRQTQQEAIQATNLAPPDVSESAILITRPPGNTTAILQGKNGASGTALVEVYRLP